jgi:glutaredoxin 3
MKPILYIKQGCPWCNDALAYFRSKGLDLEIKDVRGDEQGMAELQAISRQNKTPTLLYGDFMVADFDINEFEEALVKNPAAAAKLGL